MSQNRKRLMRIGSLAAMLLTAAGCSMKPVRPQPVLRPSVENDPCAQRLHDLSGQLLSFYASNRRLPRDVDELAQAVGTAALICPESAEPYLYDPRGRSVRNLPGQLVLVDPQPSHSGMRWGVFITETADVRTLSTKVILIDEKDIPKP